MGYYLVKFVVSSFKLRKASVRKAKASRSSDLQEVRRIQQVQVVHPLHAHPGSFKIQSAKELKSSFSACDRKKQKVTYRGSTGSSRSNRSSRTGLSLISGSSSRSRKSNWSSQTTGTILTRSTISALSSLVTLGYWNDKKIEASCTRGERTLEYCGCTNWELWWYWK